MTWTAQLQFLTETAINLSDKGLPLRPVSLSFNYLARSRVLTYYCFLKQDRGLALLIGNHFAPYSDFISLVQQN